MTHRLDTPFMAENPRITVVGCGGTGGFVAEALCRLYTGREARIVLVDHDRVEPHNLFRQNFHAREVGRYKSEALAERLSAAFDRKVGYVVRPFRKDAGGEYPGVGRFRSSLLIGCVDNARARREMEECLESRPHFWLIDAGNGKNWGQVLIGNRPAGSRNYRQPFRKDVCCELPSPAAQQPELLTAAPETKPDIDCAAALDLLDQDPTINQMMAMMVIQVVHRMAANDCPWMSLYLDLEQGTMTPRYATPENAARIAGTETMDAWKPSQNRAAPVES